MAKKTPAAAPTPEPPAEYTVVARRYRPRQFAELIGQEHVAQSLVNALESDRVAHAYLFTGARGVGKTSAARILAKALNCEKGPTPTPCGECESCLAIAEGQDVDVLEIDGASNNKVDEIRDLRANVGFRPTRGRYKIYIIDEVHMLTTGAFNALLKTLEEPPSHVKFILATTEVQKLPITILSRCQRFDFAHVGPSKIFEQLKSIVKREKHEADDDALKLVARRAAGSMRDSQSLLDQLLASCQGKLTVEFVHQVLGTAGDDRVIELATAILNKDAKTGLNLISRWIDRGLQIGELVDQLIEYWRALMLVKAGSDLEEVPLSPNVVEAVKAQAANLNLDSILAGLDIWASTKGRMRGSSHGDVLLEMAIVRLSRLEDLLSVGQLLQSVAQNGMPSAPATRPAAPADPSKKNDLTAPVSLGPLPTHVSNQAEFTTQELSESTLGSVWSALNQYLSERSPLLAAQLRSASPPAIFGPNSLAIRFHSSYNTAIESCRSEQNLQKLTEALKKLTGKPAVVKIEAVGGTAPAPAARPVANGGPAAPSGDRGKRHLLGLPFFRKAADALGAQIWHVDEGFNPASVPAAAPAAEPDEDEDATAAPPDPED